MAEKKERIAARQKMNDVVNFFMSVEEPSS
jgi:hypothetical protein